MENKYAKAERIFKALADEKRAKIIAMLLEEERYADKILAELDIAQPTLSHHMKLLCESGLVSERREGRKIFYSISEEGRDSAFELLFELLLPENERTNYQARRKAKRSSDNIVIL